MNRKKWNNCKFEWCGLGILIALELSMSSTFLGYIHVPPISVATAYIPVVVIGCLFGTTQSAFAGLIFGFGSMYKASALYVMADDRLFSPLSERGSAGKSDLECWDQTSLWCSDRTAFCLVQKTEACTVF